VLQSGRREADASDGVVANGLQPAETSPDVPLHEAILPVLREAIVTRSLAPGSRLAEATLASQLNVSRTPVRAALTRLESEGLVTIVPRAGAFVRGIAVRDINEIYEVRIALECLAAKLAAERITRVGKAQLAELVDSMKRAVSRGDVSAYANAIDEFHALVMSLSGNERLESMYMQLMPSIRRLRRLTLSRSGRPRESLKQHMAIADALLKGSPTAADRMREHLEDALSEVRPLAGEAQG
jgi:DNA-binding GntR family transcriptional regulator